MARAAKTALRYLECVAVSMFFVARLDFVDAEGLGLAETLERLAVAEPASHVGWQLLGRVVRHVCAALEEQGDARLLLATELLDEVMGYVDRTAAPVRPQGE